MLYFALSQALIGVHMEAGKERRHGPGLPIDMLLPTCCGIFVFAPEVSMSCLWRKLAPGQDA
jgi:hypothetical protein